MSRAVMTPAEAARREDLRQRSFTLTPPEGVTVRFDVASLASRMGAQILDILISFGVVLALMIPLALSPLSIGPVAGILFALLTLFIRAPYYILSELFWNGRTLGKRILRLRVISADGRGLTTHAVVMRNLMKEVEVFMPGTMLLAAQMMGVVWQVTLLIWVVVLLAVPFLNRHRQRIGDILAHTLVVSEPRSVLLSDLAETEPADRFVFTEAHLGHYGRFELQTLETFLRAHPLQGAPQTVHPSVVALAAQIRKKIDFEDPVPEADALIFLHAFYRAQRAFLERKKLYGDVREDKHHSEPP